MNYLRILLVTFIGFSLISCGSDNEEANQAKDLLLPPSPLRIQQFCTAYAQNSYDALLTMIYQSENLSEEYRKRMKYALMQREVERRKDSLFIRNVKESHVSLNHKTKSASVFLDIQYANGDIEEIVVPMVYDKGNWWIR